MNSFNYVCDNESKPCILESCFDKNSLSIQVERAVNQLVDSAWDDEDEESDVLLAVFINTVKKENFTLTAEQLAELIDCKPIQEDSSANLIFNELNCQIAPCRCREVVSRMSIVLSFGVVELKCHERPSSIRLSEILDQLQPLTRVADKDDGMKYFLQKILTYSISTKASDLISKVIQICPPQVDLMIDKIMNSELSESDMLLDNENFNQLTAIIDLPKVFERVSIRLAQLNFNLSQKSQILLNALIKFLRSKNSKKHFLNLYPLELRPIATVLNEAIHAEDELLLSLINSVKVESHTNFIILVTHFPLFAHLLSHTN
ncbi:uncharacterized protein LOC128739739 [Sabethes cyaneus]|uniref:uncharacterized protein LOC128739739 n=1 Tax=Sabethes cyaneus TaxID=53552 RepID=UPI00237E65D7|nr:uncharacterized protein LOC128739739 [Sabethes cyaneus]